MRSIDCGAVGLVGMGRLRSVCVDGYMHIPRFSRSIDPFILPTQSKKPGSIHRTVRRRATHQLDGRACPDTHIGSINRLTDPSTLPKKTTAMMDPGSIHRTYRLDARAPLAPHKELEEVLLLCVCIYCHIRPHTHGWRAKQKRGAPLTIYTWAIGGGDDTRGTRDRRPTPNPTSPTD